MNSFSQVQVLLFHSKAQPADVGHSHPKHAQGWQGEIQKQKHPKNGKVCDFTITITCNYVAVIIFVIDVIYLRNNVIYVGKAILCIF